MRLPTLSLALLLLVSYPIKTSAVDPVLTAAVLAQTAALDKVYSERNQKNNSILAAEVAINATMNEVHKIEEKVLDYLSNAQGAVQNLHQIKRAGELVLSEIPNNIKFLKSSLPGNLKGTMIAAVVSDELQNSYEEMTSLYPLVSQLVTSGSYNVQTANGSTEKKKVNLLNAAERYYVANEIVQKLERINMNIYLLAWQIRTLSFSDLFFHLAPESWCNIMASKSLVQDIIREYSAL